MKKITNILNQGQGVVAQAGTKVQGSDTLFVYM